MDQLAQQLINGLSLGSIYALIALGYTMVYGIIQLINFAHGDVYMIGAYVGYACMSILRLGFIESLVISMLACMVLGVVIERVAYKPLRNSTRIAVLITAIGVSLLLEYVMVYFVGAAVRSYPPLPDYFNAQFNVGGVIISSKSLIIIGISVALLHGVHMLLERRGLFQRMAQIEADDA